MIRPGIATRELKSQFELLIESLPPQNKATSSNPNRLEKCNLADLQILPYLDMKIVSAYRDASVMTPIAMGHFFFSNKGSAESLVKRMKELANDLLDKNSAVSQELLARAAEEVYAVAEPQGKRAKRGRRTIPDGTGGTLN